jgi:DNA-directed RNA polymerase specialized sigma24 family protein
MHPDEGVGHVGEDAADSDLLSAVATGSTAALEELYRRHAPWLTLRLSRRCADRAVVDEVLQDTFVAVWRNAGSFRGQGEAGAWLWGIAVRRLVDAFRRQPPVSYPLESAEVLGTLESAEDRVLLGVEPRGLDVRGEQGPAGRAREQVLLHGGDEDVAQGAVRVAFRELLVEVPGGAHASSFRKARRARIIRVLTVPAGTPRRRPASRVVSPSSTVAWTTARSSGLSRSSAPARSPCSTPSCTRSSADSNVPRTSALSSG